MIYLGDEQVAIAYAVEVSESTTANITFEYTYDPLINKAATVQSIETRLANYATIAALNLKQDKLFFNGNYSETNPVATLETVNGMAEELFSKIVGEDVNESFDTIKELAHWILEHPDGAAKINADILQNKTDIANNVVAINNLSVAHAELITSLVQGTVVVEKAKRDENGNVIVEYYATKTEVESVKGVSGQITLTINELGYSQETQMRQYETTIEGFEENDAIFFTPMTRADKTIIENGDLFIGTDGNKVIFEASQTLTKSFTLNYFIVKGRA